VKIAVISNGARSLLNFRGPLMAEMIRRGHEVVALAPDHSAETRRALQAMDVRPLDFAMTRAGIGPIQEIGTIMDLRRLLRAHRPDVCFSYFLKPVIYGTIAAWLAGVPRRYGLIAGLGSAFASSSQRPWARSALQHAMSALAKFSFRRIDRLMFQNIDDLTEFVTRGIVVRDKAELIGATGVDLDEWPLTSLPEGPITFILAARLLRDKGVGEYAEAARQIKATHPHTRFILLGNVDQNPDTFTSAEVWAWVSEGLVEWPGHVPVAPWLAEAHVFVLPSYYREGVPRSTQEAMAMGRPIITTDAPGCRETVVEGVNGYCIPPRDASSLAAAMTRFIAEPSLLSRMGFESRRIAEERFDVHRINDKLLAAMEL